MPSRLRSSAIACALLLTAVSVASQETALTIIRADPSGSLATLEDADQIRIAFSEPMVAIGTVPDGRAPSWLHMTPAWAGAFYWAGTRTLVFSPDVATPFPYSTKFTVRIDASATSVAGRRLAAPYEMSFTTPTLRLTHAYADRKSERFDSPVVITLSFNQPVRAEDVLAHTRVSLEPHDWKKPVLSPGERTYWQGVDPDGLARFDAKVAAVERVASSSDQVAVRIADPDRNTESYDDEPGHASLETVGAPPPEAWLRIAIDSSMPAAEGTESHPAESSVVELEHALFLPNCLQGCDTKWPRAISGIAFTSPVSRDVIADALTVTDVTAPDAARPVTRGERRADTSAFQGLAGLGFGTQPAMTRWQLRVRDLQALDGQTLGYSWAGLSERSHDDAEFAFGGSVFEAGSGSHLPFIARNIASVNRWLLPVTASTLMATLGNIREGAFGADLAVRAPITPPPGTGAETVLAPAPKKAPASPKPARPAPPQNKPHRRS